MVHKCPLRRLGYRLVLNELKHPKQAKPGEAIRLSMKWQNTGSAPCYQPYRLAYRLTSSDGNHWVFVGDVTVEKWLPGEIELFTEEFFKQPADLPSGEIVAVADSIRLPDDLEGNAYISVSFVRDAGSPGDLAEAEPACAAFLDHLDRCAAERVRQVAVVVAVAGPAGGAGRAGGGTRGRGRCHVVHPSPIALLS